MEDSSRISSSIKKFEVPSSASSKMSSKRSLIACAPKTFKRMPLLNYGGRGREYAGHIAIFLLKVAALEMTRRISRAKCPFVWRSLQALQILCYPPFKWIQRWAPFSGLVMGMQKLSKPMFFLSIATAFSDESESYQENTDEINDSQPPSEPSAGPSTEDTSFCEEVPQSQEPESWLLQLYKELEMQEITLPERINEDELRRFYAAANGSFSCLIPSIKKTIRWRESYKILSAEELEMWSNLVFWHGYDVKLRPCLIVRLGLACSSLASPDRPRFAQAIVSQLEHGVLHLVNIEDPQITVLMDCEGLSPFKFPMQMMRSCSTLMQDHYPNRLGCLFVIRLPPVVRVIAQTFIQVLKPVTRKKLRIEGEMYKNVLSEYLQTVPAYLGGKCTCPKCSTHHNNDSWTRWTEGSNMIDPSGDFTSDESPSVGGNPYFSDVHVSSNCDHVLRTAIIAILMLWIFIGFLAGMYEV
ncbi:CRAL-TRIO domain [Macleaya cordata]|uniref:CRAL-TRIO domain n=1 Tax=Macleaya cordata TaxID=56857 RepID=A0A200R6J7_MACCD|nr:CRAL-TRIO domain [Macleaya cordata]